MFGWFKNRNNNLRHLAELKRVSWRPRPGERERGCCCRQSGPVCFVQNKGTITLFSVQSKASYLGIVIAFGIDAQEVHRSVFLKTTTYVPIGLFLLAIACFCCVCAQSLSPLRANFIITHARTFYETVQDQTSTHSAVHLYVCTHKELHQ